MSAKLRFANRIHHTRIIITILKHMTLPDSTRIPHNIGRTVGILLLLNLAFALMLPFIISSSITSGTPAYLTAVAEDASMVRLAVFISFIGAALTVYLGITTFHVFRSYSKSVALLFVIVCAISCTLDLIQGGTVMSMLSISNAFIASDSKDTELYSVIGAAVASARRNAHMVQLLGFGVWIFVFYFSLFRFQLIPRWLAAIGCIGIISQFIGVTLMMLLGYPMIGEMAMPLLPIQITVGIWLIVKGFNVSPDKAQLR